MWVKFHMHFMDSLTSFRMAGVVHWTLTESALDEVEIHRRLEGSRERQLRALNFPAGIETIEEMEKTWAKIDFGGKQSTQEMIDAIKGLASHAKCVPVLFFLGHPHDILLTTFYSAGMPLRVSDLGARRAHWRLSGKYRARTSATLRVHHPQTRRHKERMTPPRPIHRHRPHPHPDPSHPPF
jgi:hypothetical protein